MKTVVNETFSLRHGESVSFFDIGGIVGAELPKKLRYAVQLRSLTPPPGNRHKTRTVDGAPVVDAAVVGALYCSHEDREGWQWIQLSPATKEYIGDLLMDYGAEMDKWYYMFIEEA